MAGSFYLLTLPFVLVAMLGALFEMGHALDEEDLERFVLWVGVGSAIAGLPLFL